ncbi:MAG: immunity 17 family protein [Anaerolineales bacterium]|nr:immunity 17 family protein [Anaerolineales bacterium]
MPVWTVVILVGAGLYCLAGAVFDWEWFLGGRRSEIFVRILGRLGARFLYALVGLLVAGIGIAGALGWI